MVPRELFRQYKLFSRMPEEIAAAAQDEAQIALYAPGEVVIGFDEPFTFFGLILDGEVEALISEEDDQPMCIETLGPGSYFGDMSILTGLASPVDMIAKSPSRILLLPVALFRRWVQADPFALQTFSKSIARRSTLVERGKQEAADRRKAAHTDANPYGLALTPEQSQRILVINLRSGSLKYRFFDTDDDANNVEGQVEWIGESRALQTHTTHKGTAQIPLGMIHHHEALQAALDMLVDPKTGVLENLGADHGCRTSCGAWRGQVR